MAELALILVSTVLVNNFVLVKFLGLCPFLGVSRKLETGMCHVNCSSVNDEPHVPFGGSKASGLGKHGGKWSMETFTETRWITLDRGGRPFPPVF